MMLNCVNYYFLHVFGVNQTLDYIGSFVLHILCLSVKSPRHTEALTVLESRSVKVFEQWENVYGCIISFLLLLT